MGNKFDYLNGRNTTPDVTTTVTPSPTVNVTTQTTSTDESVFSQIISYFKDGKFKADFANTPFGALMAPIVMLLAAIPGVGGFLKTTTEFITGIADKAILAVKKFLIEKGVAKGAVTLVVAILGVAGALVVALTILSRIDNKNVQDNKFVQWLFGFVAKNLNTLSRIPVIGEFFKIIKKILASTVRGKYRGLFTSASVASFQSADLDDLLASYSLRAVS